MTNKAHAAVIAAQNIKNWGHYAARRYAEKRGVTMRLYLLAYCLEYGLI